MSIVNSLLPVVTPMNDLSPLFLNCCCILTAAFTHLKKISFFGRKEGEQKISLLPHRVFVRGEHWQTETTNQSDALVLLKELTKTAAVVSKGFLEKKREKIRCEDFI
jgi:hypothetical protein